jgi:hypothetical protein
MRWVQAFIVLTAVAVRGQAASSPVLIFVDHAHASNADRGRLSELARTLAGDGETVTWSAADDPAARYTLSFTEAFDIFRGNDTVLQTIKTRECSSGAPSCGADLPVRARQALDAFDELAGATVKELATAVGELDRKREPRLQTVIFVTTGLPYRREPRRELDALKNALRASKATLVIVDASTSGRAPGVARMSRVVSATTYLATDERLREVAGREASLDPPVASDPPDTHAPASRLPQEVMMASTHAVAFAEAAETLLADEHYVQEVKTRPSSTSMPRYSTAGITVEKRALDSEVALIQLKSGELWLLARDVQRIDDRPVPDAQRVPLPSIRAGSEAEAVTQLKEIATQGARFNIGGIRRDLNVPTLALWLLTPGILSRFEFSVARTQNIEGRDAVEVRFKERKAPYLFNVDDVPVPTSGRFWLDRQRRAVIRTELTLQKTIEGRTYAQAQIVVNYYYDGKANAWVPRNMAEQYYASRSPQFVIANATYSNVRRFSSSVRIVK